MHNTTLTAKFYTKIQQANSDDVKKKKQFKFNKKKIIARTGSKFTKLQY